MWVAFVLGIFIGYGFLSVFIGFNRFGTRVIGFEKLKIVSLKDMFKRSFKFQDDW